MDSSRLHGGFVLMTNESFLRNIFWWNMFSKKSCVKLRDLIHNDMHQPFALTTSHSHQSLRRYNGTSQTSSTLVTKSVTKAELEK
jgi:hypothetical protein